MKAPVVSQEGKPRHMNTRTEPLSIAKVRTEFPSGFTIVKIEQGIALIWNPTQNPLDFYWADFRPFLGSVTKIFYTGRNQNRHHRQEMIFERKRLVRLVEENIWMFP